MPCNMTFVEDFIRMGFARTLRKRHISLLTHNAIFAIIFAIFVNIPFWAAIWFALQNEDLPQSVKLNKAESGDRHLVCSVIASLGITQSISLCYVISTAHQIRFKYTRQQSVVMFLFHILLGTCSINLNSCTCNRTVYSLRRLWKSINVIKQQIYMWKRPV